MYGGNPFDGWKAGDATTPSIFGALPYPGAGPSSGSSALATFTFASPPNSNKMNCTVLGPDNTPFIYIITDPAMPTYTVFKNPHGQNLALIEWQQHPMVEVRGVIVKQEIRQWLPLTPDRKARRMDLSGSKFYWTPQGETINLSAPTPHGPHNFPNLRDVSIIATFLLQCGRNID
ncbi:hypothetical protein ONZ45_g5961 [Pleurotus djamor]|nr:hypothetical protein ONZ45_g5961 [Pleurotus djamor]